MIFQRRSNGALAAVVRFLPVTAFPVLFGGCNMVVMNPMGDIALQQRNLVIFATALMLLIVIPVIALVGIFAWRRSMNWPLPSIARSSSD